MRFPANNQGLILPLPITHMKRYLLLLCTAISLAAGAQSVNVKYSAPFEEPEALDSKLFQCSNGNTMLLNFTKHDGIEVRVYDTAHKPKGRATLTSKVWDAGIMNKSAVDGIFNIGDDVVVFLEQLDSRKPILYRLVLSSENGRILKQDKIAEMPGYGAGAGYAMMFGGVAPKGFHVEKDPNSGAYAVLAFDGFASETAQRIELIHFDGAHTEIARSFYDSPENRYKFINYLGMVVRGTDQVVLSTYAYNTKAHGGGGSHIFLSVLQAGKFEHRKLDFTEDLRETTAAFTFNTKKNVYQLLTLSRASGSKLFGSNTYTSMLVGIDPASYAIKYVKPLDTRLATEYRRTHYGLKSDYTGMPMDMSVNEDGTLTVILEEHTIMETRQGHLNILGDVAVLEFDEDANPVNGYVVRKNHVTKRDFPYLSHPNERKGHMDFAGSWSFMAGAKLGYYSFNYLGTPAGRFVFFNDHPKNFERDAEKSPSSLQGVSDANTICYRLTNGEMSKFHFFGKPGGSFDNRLALLTSGTYSEVTGDFAVMIVEQQGRKKMSRVAWASLK